MKLSNQWNRKRDGWVERKRRFQEMFRERFFGADRSVPVLVGAPVPAARETVPDRGSK